MSNTIWYFNFTLLTNWNKFSNFRTILSSITNKIILFDNGETTDLLSDKYRKVIIEWIFWFLRYILFHDHCGHDQPVGDFAVTYFGRCKKFRHHFRFPPCVFGKVVVYVKIITNGTIPVSMPKKRRDFR